MRRFRRNSASPQALFLLPALLIPAWVQGQSTSFLDHQGLTRELREMTGGSALASMESLATTREGREVWLVRVGDPDGAPFEERPAVLVVGNLEGDHLVGSHLALEAVRYLMANAGNEETGEALRANVFYVFPRLNPDGAEAVFATVQWNRRENTLPWDDDNDGRTDEDGPEDLNGDGFATVMRVADPGGAFMIHPENEALMKRADAAKGETGRYKVYWEGTDEDGDGFINEDGPGGVDLNRNFQHAYPYWQAGSGPHMVSEPETRALMDFVVAHRNIGAILTFGVSDNLVVPPNAKGELAEARVPELPGFAEASNEEVFEVGMVEVGGDGGRGWRGSRRGGGGWLRGAQPGRDNDPSSGARPATTVAAQDRVYFETISEAYKEVTGIESVPYHRTPEGAFFQYGYFQYGVPSFSTLGWGGWEADSGEDEEEAKGDPWEEARLEWVPFQHPELGEVEIGGFRPYALVNPEADEVAALGVKHGEFLVKLAGMLPRVSIAETQVEGLGGGVFRVTVKVENSGFLPTSLEHGARSRSVGPTFVQIQVDEDAILSGAEKTTDVGVLSGSGGREEVTWVIRGREGSQVDIRLHSMKAGHDTATINLR